MIKWFAIEPPKDKSSGSKQKSQERGDILTFPLDQI